MTYFVSAHDYARSVSAAIRLDNHRERKEVFFLVDCMSKSVEKSSRARSFIIGANDEYLSCDANTLRKSIVFETNKKIAVRSSIVPTECVMSVVVHTFLFW